MKGPEANLLPASIRTPAPLTNFGKSSRLWRSSLLTHNHRGSLHLLHGATDEELNHIVPLRLSWRRTCENAYSHSSHNKELTCRLSEKRNQHSVAHMTLSWTSFPGVQKRSRLRVLSMESKRLSRAQDAIPIWKEQSTLPILLIKRRKDAQPKAASEASEKRWSCLDLTWPKSAGFKQRHTVRIESFRRSANQLSQRKLYSSGISSSHPDLMRHRSWRISFAVRTRNARKHRGSKIVPATDWIPQRVDGRKFIQTLKRNESDTTLHCTLKPRWTGYSSLRALIFLMSFDRSNSGVVSRTLRLLRIHLFILKPTRESRTRKLSTCWIASEGRDLKQSST